MLLCRPTPFPKETLLMKRQLIKPYQPGANVNRPNGPRLLVVIDHREARIFRTELHGTEPESITPYDPHGFGRALHYNQDDADGQRKPELKSFYEAIAKTLKGAAHILLFGSGTGASSAMEQLRLELRHNHHDLSACVVGALTIDAHHTTDDQLLAKARDVYANLAPVLGDPDERY